MNWQTFSKILQLMIKLSSKLTRLFSMIAEENIRDETVVDDEDDEQKQT